MIVWLSWEPYDKILQSILPFLFQWSIQNVYNVTWIMTVYNRKVVFTFKTVRTTLWRNILYLQGRSLSVTQRTICWIVIIGAETSESLWQSVKISSGQGIVKPPIGWSNPNSSSNLLRRAWNEGWLRYETGTTYLFFWPSPTYTTRNPFGAAEAALLLVEAAEMERPRIFFAPNKFLTKAISSFFCLKVLIFLKLLNVLKDSS